MNLVLTFALTFGVYIQISNANSTTDKPSREHKIHNIVLYPDKHSWCTKTSIDQVVSHPGCNSITVENNVCVGACFSYIVPRTVPETPGDVSPYCDSCKPSHVSWKKVSLECTDKQNQNQNQTFIKYVEFIHDCNCAACLDEKKFKVVPEENEDANDDFNSSLSDDLPISLTAGSNSSSKYSNNTEFKTIISSALKTLNNEDANIMENNEVRGLHRNVWKILLEKVEILNNLTDTNVFNQLVSSVEEEMKVKFNYKRLKQALLKLKKHETITKSGSKISSADHKNNDTDGGLVTDSNMYQSPILLRNSSEQMNCSSMPDIRTSTLTLLSNDSNTSYQNNNAVGNNTIPITTLSTMQFEKKKTPNSGT